MKTTTAPAPPPVSVRKQAARRGLAAFCTTWLFLASVEIILMAITPSSSLHGPSFTSWERLRLLATDLDMMTVVMIVLAGPSALLIIFMPAWHHSSRLLRVGKSLLTLLTFLCCVLYGISWAMFWSVGGFLDRGAVLFGAAQPVQIFIFMPRSVLLTASVVILVMVISLSFVLPRLLNRLSAQVTLCWIAGILVIMVLTILTARRTQISPPPDDPTKIDEAEVMDHAQEYDEATDLTSGPFAHLRYAIDDYFSAASASIVASKDIEVIHRPIISLSQYLGTIDRAKFQPRNVLFILCESLRSDQLAIYGGSAEIMPNTNALAGEALVFRNAYTQAPHTNYAMTSPVSSCYPLRANREYFYPPEAPYPRVLLYDILKPLGYRVGIFSSHSDCWGNVVNYLNTPSVDLYHHSETFAGPTFVPDGDGSMANWVAKHHHTGYIDDRYTVGELIKFIDTTRAPFFAQVFLQSSHFPYYCPPDFPRRFAPGPPSFPMTFGYYDRHDIPGVKALYADSLHYEDAQLAKLFAYLKAKGLWDNTIVVLTGDHGQAFYEHEFPGHANCLYQEVLRVPLVVKAPGLSPGLLSSPAQHVDIAPSVLHLLGLPPHPAFQGRDLFDPAGKPDPAIYCLLQTSVRYACSIIQGDYKLIANINGKGLRLYDLKQDPEERHNIVLARPEIARKLGGRLAAWRAAQLEYYTNPLHQKTWYPPNLAD